MDKRERKIWGIASFIILVITMFIIAGKYDTDINKENAISDSTAIANSRGNLSSLLSDTNFVNIIYNNLTKGQIAELMYNTDRETWDTVSKVELICTYFNNIEFYDSIPSDYSPEWINSVVVTE